MSRKRERGKYTEEPRSDGHGCDVTSCLSSCCLDFPPMTECEQNYGRGMLAWPALPVYVVSEHMCANSPSAAATLPVTGDNQYLRAV